MGELSKSEKAKDTRLRTIYKTTLEAQNVQRECQSNACAICGRKFEDYQSYQDHDHRCCPRRLKNFCGRCNRGILCYLCNKYAVGLIEWMEKMNIRLDKIVEYKKFWDGEIARKGGYEPKPKSRPKSRRKSKA